MWLGYCESAIHTAKEARASLTFTKCYISVSNIKRNLSTVTILQHKFYIALQYHASNMRKFRLNEKQYALIDYICTLVSMVMTGILKYILVMCTHVLYVNITFQIQHAT